LSPDVQLHADPRELQFVAAYFFSGREVPENLAADAISLPSREELTGPGSTFWGRVLANKLLKKTTLAIFLIDLIMANKMEHACFNKEKYFEDRVRRHDTYEEVVKRLGSEKSTSTPMACRDTSQQEEHETEDKAPGNDDLTEPDSVNNTPQPASSKKRKKNKKKNTKGITDTPTKDTSGEGPAPAITLNETPQDNQNTSGDGPVPAVTPTVTPQDIQDTCQDGATSPKSDEEKDSPPRKPLSKPEILPRLSDSIDTEDSAGWNIVESKASQRIKARGNARGSLFDLFPDASSSSNKAEQPLSGNASQVSSSIALRFQLLMPVYRGLLLLHGGVRNQVPRPRIVLHHHQLQARSFRLQSLDRVRLSRNLCHRQRNILRAEFSMPRSILLCHQHHQHPTRVRLEPAVRKAANFPKDLIMPAPI